MKSSKLVPVPGRIDGTAALQRRVDTALLGREASIFERLRERAGPLPGRSSLLTCSETFPAPEGKEDRYTHVSVTVTPEWNGIPSRKICLACGHTLEDSP